MPYILEDYTSVDTIAEKMMDMYLTKQNKVAYEHLQTRVKEYADYEFNYEKRIQQWDKLLNHTIESWKDRYVRYVFEGL